jgi:hypothetical protein
MPNLLVTELFRANSSEQTCPGFLLSLRSAELEPSSLDRCLAYTGLELAAAIDASRPDSSLL